MARRGFTLIEIMIATTILGIIMLTVYGVLSRALYAKNHAEDRADLYASGREAVLKIADELEGALPPTAGRNIGFVGIPGTGRTPSDAVQFAVVVRRLYGVSQNRGGRALVSYSLDPMQNTRSLFALRRQEQLLTEVPTEDEDAAAGTDPDTGGTAPAPVAFAAYVLDQVAGLRFRYLNPQTGEWTDSWDTTVQVPTGQPPIGLPGAVEVTLFLADTQGGVHDFSTIVDLPLYVPPPTPVAVR
ncbi:MAG: prepilin-type N-terminal cleavage/methylation domain-containing protein [Candidatus Binatia bacterium]